MQSISPKKFIITDKQLQELLAYIATLGTGNIPFGKVFDIVTMVRALPEYKEEGINLDE